MSAALISIIGPPAVGKTTLAELLCADLPAELIREDYRGNPFLEQSYAGGAAARLPGQLCFLVSRVRQLAVTTWPEAGLFVSDYGYCQDRVFARARLGIEDYKLYEQLAWPLARVVHPPDVLVHLDAASQTLLRRIAERGRDFERVMDAEFLDSMRAEYARAAADALCPVIEFDCEAADFRDGAVRAALAADIRAKLSGR
ncbi:MAG TPA: deoxynucleoside kinase [Phycisphaerae bacterium]|nr:deoxynucleoside kinase [Phycisphaerae bacterium]